MNYKGEVPEKRGGKFTASEMGNRELAENVC
jgi:hypothetical protein